MPQKPVGEPSQNDWDTAHNAGWISDLTVPLTRVTYPESVVLSPPCDKAVSCTFTRRMVAFPLTVNGEPGSEPDGKANWWSKYFSNKAAQHGKAAWVQGHLLNHHIHGSGTDPRNLVPITYDLNGTMSAWAEEYVKKEILNKGKILWYEVTAHWQAGMKVGQQNNWAQNATNSAAELCKLLDGHKLGECLAPTSVEWKAWEIKWNGAGWDQVVQITFGGYKGIENGMFYNSWNS